MEPYYHNVERLSRREKLVLRDLGYVKRPHGGILQLLGENRLLLDTGKDAEERVLNAGDASRIFDEFGGGVTVVDYGHPPRSLRVLHSDAPWGACFEKQVGRSACGLVSLCNLIIRLDDPLAGS